MTKENKISAALEFAKKEVLENKENGNSMFVAAFTQTFLDGLKAAGQKNQKPADYMLNGVIVGYALRYMNEQNQTVIEEGEKNVNNSN